MRNRRRSVFASVALLLVFTTGSSLRAADNVELKFRPKAGETQKLAALIEQKTSQTINGNTQTIQQTMGLGYGFSVLSVDTDGAAFIKVTYDAVMFKQQGPMGNIEYDSTNAPATVPAMAKGFAALAGQSFEMKISSLGKVMEIKGLDAMVTAILTKLDLAAEDPRKAQMEKTIRAQFGEEAQREALENMLAIYPEKMIKVGESWTKVIALTKGFPLKMDNTFTLKEAREGIATLDVKSKLSTNPDAAPMDLGQAKLTYNLTGDQTGTIQVNQASGWMQSAQMTQKVSGTMKMEGGPGGKPLEIPISIETVLKLESK